jgi:hypothetical protein
VGRSSRTKREARDADRPVPGADEDAAATPPRPPCTVFWLILIALPFALLGGAEFALRLAGFGQDREPLFMSSPSQPDYLQANPRVVTRFFTDPVAGACGQHRDGVLPGTKGAGHFPGVRAGRVERRRLPLRPRRRARRRARPAARAHFSPSARSR